MGDMMKNASFLKWASHSLIGHIVMSEVIMSVPLLINFLGLSYSDGTLTLTSALRSAGIAAIAGSFPRYSFGTQYPCH
jgi:hypothetical protein